MEKPKFIESSPESEKVPFRRALEEQEQELNRAKSPTGRWVALAMKRMGDKSIQD